MDEDPWSRSWVFLCVKRADTDLPASIDLPPPRYSGVRNGKMGAAWLLPTPWYRSSAVKSCGKSLSLLMFISSQIH